MIHNETLNDHRKVCNYCAIYIALLVIFFVANISISSAFVYFYWYLKKKILILKQQFIRHISGKNQRSNMMNGIYYFFNDMIQIKIFYSNLLKTEKKSCKYVDI